MHRVARQVRRRRPFRAVHNFKKPLVGSIDASHTMNGFLLRCWCCCWNGSRHWRRHRRSGETAAARVRAAGTSVGRAHDAIASLDNHIIVIIIMITSSSFSQLPIVVNHCMRTCT
jgi:hypothetical protein